MINEILEWSENYFQHKDIIEKKLKEIKTEENKLILIYSDKKYLVINTLSLNKKITKELKDNKKYSKIYLVCDKNEDNVEFLIKNWKLFLIKNFNLIFTNTNANDKVIINPSIHNMITTKENLEKSIKTLFYS